MDRISIVDLELYGYHGVLAEEKTLGQKFLVSCDMYLDLSKAGKTDNLTETIDYSKACLIIKDIVENERYKLIEKLADVIAEKLLLEYEILTEVKVCIKKPQAPIHIPMDTVSVSISRKRHKVYLSIGSNIGDKEGYLDQAIDGLNALVGTRVIEVSDYLVTEPYGNVDQDDFLNGALLVETIKDPFELLDDIHRIELEAGRERKVHWGPRTLDIDILFYDDEVICSKDLTIPHIEIEKRWFVLKPLSEIAPFYVHPILKKSITQMLCELDQGDNRN